MTSKARVEIKHRLLGLRGSPSPGRAFLFLGFIFFLLVFPPLALHHTFAEDEFGDSSCLIGKCVSHAQGIADGILRLESAAYTAPLFKEEPREGTTAPVASVRSTRAPPISIP